MPLIEYPLGCVFMGRRKDITQEGRARLRRLRYEQRQFLEIHTLDWFIDSACTVIGGGWNIPTRVLTHKDLNRGLPPGASRYVGLFAKGGPFAHEYPAEILRERKGKYQREIPLRDDEI